MIQGLLHGLMYVGLLLVVGLAVFLAVVLPQSYAGGRVRERLRRLLLLAATVSALAAVLQSPVAATYAQGRGLADVVSAFNVGLVGKEVLQAVLLLVGLAVVCSTVSKGPPDRAGRAPRRVALVAGAVLVVLAPAVVGHTRAYPPTVVLVTVDALHLTAGAVWLGGLVGLAVSMRPLARREVVAAETLARFSAIAGGLVLLVALTGSLLAWRILGAWSAFVETASGVLLIVKIGIALVVAAVGGWDQVPAAAPRPACGRLRRPGTVFGWCRARSRSLLLVLLLGVTGFLVSQSPRPDPGQGPRGTRGRAGGNCGRPAGPRAADAATTRGQHGDGAGPGRRW